MVFIHVVSDIIADRSYLMCNCVL